MISKRPAAWPRQGQNQEVGESWQDLIHTEWNLEKLGKSETQPEGIWQIGAREMTKT